METYARRLAESLATVINLFDPEVIVLGGGVSNIASLYARVPRALDRVGVLGRGRHAARARRPRRFERRPRRRMAVGVTWLTEGSVLPATADTVFRPRSKVLPPATGLDALFRATEKVPATEQPRV